METWTVMMWFEGMFPPLMGGEDPRFGDACGQKEQDSEGPQKLTKF